MPDVVLTADIGGTHITSALIDLSHQKLILPSLVRKTVNADDTAHAIITAWSECLKLAAGDHKIPRICLAMPGPVDCEQGISLMKGQDKFDSLYGLNLKTLLGESLNINPGQIFIENDAACFLQGEVFTGCASGGYKKVIGITLGTGLGSAVYENGLSRSADLWCWPFNGAMAEDFFSTKWFTSRYAQLTGKKTGGVKDIIDQMGSEQTARVVFREFGSNLGVFLESFIEREKPEMVVIGGNIARAYEHFCVELEDIVLARFPSVKIRKSLLGEQSALYGAASSWYMTQQQDVQCI